MTDSKPQVPDLGSVRLLQSLVDKDVEWYGPVDSTMVRGGLLQSVLHHYLQLRAAAEHPQVAPGTAPAQAG